MAAYPTRLSVGLITEYHQDRATAAGDGNRSAGTEPVCASSCQSTSAPSPIAPAGNASSSARRSLGTRLPFPLADLVPIGGATALAGVSGGGRVRRFSTGCGGDIK